jgi:penicillin G amidase
VPKAINLNPIPEIRGSNQWAVGKERTKEKAAILACDMHLSLRVPNIWYCLHLEYRTPDGELVQVGGASLPGTPIIAVGSNRHIAWGFTNASIDTADLVTLEGDDQSYLTPDGSKPFQTDRELIFINGKKPEELLIRSTIWGPVHPERFLGKEMAISWIAHNQEALNFRLLDLETISSTQQALERAPEIHIPVLNFMVADRNGQIGWTFIGAIPQRKGYIPEVPISFADGKRRWEGMLPSFKIPKIFAPSDHILWTANNKVIGDPALGIEYHNPIRAYQIRQRLLSTNEQTLEGMIALQLDDEALFYNRWRQLLLDSLNLNQTSHLALKNLIESENLSCSCDSLSYNWIRSFRENVIKHLTSRFIAPCLDSDSFNPYLIDLEEPFFKIVSEKPLYLLDPKFASWEQELSSLVDLMLVDGDILCSKKWGQCNQAKIQHPLSSAIPLFSDILNMPRDFLSGDYFVPHVNGPSVGASVRLVVAPGHEEKGILGVPCGQSGHPLSPHYRDLHNLWTKGTPSPFLPGKTVHTLTLVPE